MSKRSKQQWRELIVQFEQSGLSQAQFCQQLNINAKYFSLRFRQRQVELQQASNSDFIAVQHIKPQTSTPHNLKLSISQVQLELPSDVSPQWLGTLMRELVA